MRWSKYYIPTLKEAPAEAEVISHQLLIRAGMIRRLTAGVYSYLPLGLKAVNKVADIVREEMDRAGSLEVLLPAVQPADLWVESGRWEQYGKELLRFKDRHDRDSCLGPTHEEVITDLVRGEVRSYRQLPLSLYQIQTKFRDEIRPRFGLMRGREFIMKDAYSFDRDDAGADESYRNMYKTYQRVFGRFAMRFRAVEADSGSIGGSFSHEFMVLAQTGEDTIVACTACDYASNVERAEIAPPAVRDAELPPAVQEALTPDLRSVDEVSAFLNVHPSSVAKTLLLMADGRPVAAMVRGDRELNEIKLKNLLHADALRMATPEEVLAVSCAPEGFAGPVGLKASVIVADNELKVCQGWVTGGNKKDSHLLNVSLLRDVKDVRFADIREITTDDPCPRCCGPLKTMRGIEVGHVFKLGLKYSQALRALYLDENGREQFMVMGCYGIGVSRVVAACIEQNHDERGILFPPPMAPFEVILVNLDPRSSDVCAKVEELYAFLRGLGLDVLMDDREERPGVKFNDADLIGAPMQLVLGGKGLARGVVEAKDRRSGQKNELPLSCFEDAFSLWRKTVYDGWNMIA